MAIVLQSIPLMLHHIIAGLRYEGSGGGLRTQRQRRLAVEPNADALAPSSGRHRVMSASRQRGTTRENTMPGTESNLDIHQFICRQDNFGVLIRDPASGAVASIDAPNGEEIARELAAKGWKLTHILTTHRHGDHTDGNLQLKQATGCTIIGPAGEADKVPGIDKTVDDGDSFEFGKLDVRVLNTSGHTKGHISFWMPAAEVVFVGDTLFAMGCGRVMEGTPQHMWGSLSKLAALPPSTRVYCGHEYTLANATFSLTIEPENEALQTRARRVAAQRAKGEMTLPTTIGEELATNPFLRAASPAIRKRLNLEGAQDWQVFAEVRERKNKA
jgi:hydroxyacylglutathione hydrolase